MARRKQSSDAPAAADVELKDPEVAKQFLVTAEPPTGDAQALIQEQAQVLTQDSIDGSEDSGGNIPANTYGYEEVGERVYHQQIDPRRHRWGTLSNEPVDAVQFSGVPREEPKEAVAEAQQQSEQKQNDTNAESGGQG